MKKIPMTPKAKDVLKTYGLDFSMLQNSSLVTFDSGETILNQGAPVENLFILINGKVKVRIFAANGKDLMLSYYLQSGMLGDVEFVQEDPSASATSVAVFQTECIAIPFTSNQNYLIGNAVFLHQVAKGLSTKLINNSYYYMTSVLYTGEERLCAYILMAEHNNLFTEILSDVSKSVGISYRHLFRILDALCVKGVLGRKESGFEILDRQYLMEKCRHM